MGQPNVLYIMTDQQRFDALAAMGNEHIYTPNMDRLARRGAMFTRAYSTCPVCVPARATIRTGREPHTTGVYANMRQDLVEGQSEDFEARCGTYLARRMQQLGYRTFGIGKFHTIPWDADIGYDVHLHSEELYASPDQRARDSYAAFIREHYPQFDWVEGLMGERTEMYYMPQMSPQPPEITVEGWAAARAVEQIQRNDDTRPYFGFVSFVGPHPPLAPPIPFNRMYDPDRMPDPIRGDITVDHMDEQIPWMNYAIWADDVNDSHARVLRARYFGELSYIDWCLGKILDAVDARDDADNTVIAFYSDHGDHLGDHHAWQKESYFEPSCHVPFLLSWPERIKAETARDEFVCLTDLFAIATGAAGALDVRDGHDVLGMLDGSAASRERIIGTYGTPGTPRFKIMVREGDWKYIYFANGAREQLFNLKTDPQERSQLVHEHAAVADRLRATAIAYCNRPNINRALKDGDLGAFPYDAWPRRRIYQFDPSRGVRGFPEHPEDVLKDFEFGAWMR